MKRPVCNASSPTSRKSRSSGIRKSSKEKTPTTSPPSTPQRGKSSPGKEDDKPAESRIKNKRTSRFSRRSVQKSITRTLSNISLKPSSSRYSKLSDSCDQSSYNENSGASCGLEGSRNYRSSSLKQSSATFEPSSSSMRSTPQRKKGKASSKQSNSWQNAMLLRPSPTPVPSSSRNVRTSTPKASTLDDSPTPGKRTFSRSQSAKHATKCTSDVDRSVTKIKSESVQAMRPSNLRKSVPVKPSASKLQCEASKTYSTIQTAISRNSTSSPKPRTSSRNRKQSPFCKSPTKMSPGSVASGKRGLAMISGDRAKTGHPKPKALTAAKTGISRDDSHTLSTRLSSSRHKASAGKNAKRVYVHHHHVVIPPHCSDVIVHRRPRSRPPPQVACPICRCDIQATVYSRLGCCFDCGSQHGYCSVSSDDCW